MTQFIQLAIPIPICLFTPVQIVVGVKIMSIPPTLLLLFILQMTKEIPTKLLEIYMANMLS